MKHSWIALGFLMLVLAVTGVVCLIVYAGGISITPQIVIAIVVAAVLIALRILFTVWVKRQTNAKELARALWFLPYLDMFAIIAYIALVVPAIVPHR